MPGSSSQTAPSSNSESSVLVERSDLIATIRLDRRERRNAMDGATLDALDRAIEPTAIDDEVRVVIITGSGESFCAGADTNEMLGGKNPAPHAHGDVGSEGLRRGFKNAQDVILCIHKLEKLTIAMVDGRVMGAGFDIACACDMRTGSDTARFLSASVYFPNKLGFLNRMEAPEDLEDVTMKQAGQIAVGSPISK